MSRDRARDCYLTLAKCGPARGTSDTRAAIATLERPAWMHLPQEAPMARMPSFRAARSLEHLFLQSGLLKKG